MGHVLDFQAIRNYVRMRALHYFDCSLYYVFCTYISTNKVFYIKQGCTWGGGDESCVITFEEDDSHKQLEMITTTKTGLKQNLLREE